MLNYLAGYIKVYHKYTSRNLPMQRLIARLHYRHDITDLWAEGDEHIPYDHLDEILENVGDEEPEELDSDESEDSEDSEDDGEAPPATNSIQEINDGGVVKRFSVHKDSKEYALECDLCGHLVRPRRNLTQHMVERTARQGFKIIKMVPEEEMVWRGVDSAGNAYHGPIVAVGANDRLHVRSAKVPPPCGRAA